MITQLRIAAVQPGHAQRAHPWERARQRARRIAPTIPGAPGLGCAQHTRSVLRLDPSCHPSALALFVLRDRPHEQSGLNPCLRHGEAYFLGGTGGRPGGPGGPAGPMIPAHKRMRGEGGIASQESVSMWCSRSRATPRFHAGACQPADARGAYRLGPGCRQDPARHGGHAYWTPVPGPPASRAVQVGLGGHPSQQDQSVRAAPAVPAHPAGPAAQACPPARVARACRWALVPHPPPWCP